MKKGLFSYWTPAVQEWIAGICCVSMIAGLLFSRGVLSVAMIVLFLNAFHPLTLKKTWEDWKKNRFALFCLLFFASYFISGLWSTDTGNWLKFVQIKLPFLILPFAFFSIPLEQAKFQRAVMGGVLLVLLVGMCYSFYFLVVNPQFLTQYLHLPSPVEGDYIRFTIALVLGIQFVVYQFLHRKELLSRRDKTVLLLWGLLAVAYIHIQAAKSGLLCFYLLLLVYIIWLLPRKWKWLIILFPVLGIAGIWSLSSLPSVQKQIKNFSYEQKVWETNDTAMFNKSSSFVPRLISYKAALEVIRDHPVSGTGAGDMKVEIDKKYEEKYPNIRPVFRLIPHNQFICTMLVIGIPLSLFLVLMVLSPLRPGPANVHTIATMVIMITGMLIEAMLEVQYGVFVYLFFTLFWIVSFRKKEPIQNSATLAIN
jgi:O-antigen ligase